MKFLDPTQHWFFATVRAVMAGVLVGIGIMMALGVFLALISTLGYSDDAVRDARLGEQDRSVTGDHSYVRVDPESYDPLIDAIARGDYDNMVPAYESSKSGRKADVEEARLRQEQLDRDAEYAILLLMLHEAGRTRDQGILKAIIIEAIKEIQSKNAEGVKE